MSEPKAKGPRVTKKWTDNPGSNTEPAGELTLLIINKDGEKEEKRVRFAYLPELERLDAEQEADAFAHGRAKGVSVPQERLFQFRRGFVLAEALRDPEDLDLHAFMSEGKASAGEVVLRRLPLQSARRAYDAWWDWMQKEFPEGGIDQEQLDDSTEQAAGE